MSIAISFLLLNISHSTLKPIQHLKINQYLLFSWIFCWGIAVNIAMHCNGLGFLVGDLGAFGGRWQMWDVGNIKTLLMFWFVLYIFTNQTIKNEIQPKINLFNFCYHLY